MKIAFIFLLALTGLVTCGADDTVENVIEVDQVKLLAGQALYLSSCVDSTCHEGTAANSSRRGSTVAGLDAAIADNKGGMAALANTLSAEDKENIILALNN